jgi:hypothetical protein
MSGMFDNAASGMRLAPSARMIQELSDQPVSMRLSVWAPFFDTTLSIQPMPQMQIN